MDHDNLLVNPKLNNKDIKLIVLQSIQFFALKNIFQNKPRGTNFLLKMHYSYHCVSCFIDHCRHMGDHYHMESNISITAIKTTSQQQHVLS